MIVFGNRPVQRIREKRARERNIETEHTEKFSNRHVLTGKLICPYCGKKLRRHSAYKKYIWACGTYIDKGKETCWGIRILESVTGEWQITEPVVVREMSADGKKYYSYSTDSKADGREYGKEGDAKNQNGSILQGINRPRRTVIKL